MIVGVLGGGQLGRMLALAGVPLGHRFRFLDPDPTCPASHVGELVVGAYDDERALEGFVKGVDVVTYEFENVPARAAAWLEAHAEVWPPHGALDAAQDRVNEKTLFQACGIGVPGFVAADTSEQLHAAVASLGRPCVVKTRRGGYDGKGQMVVRAESDAARAWTELGRAPGGLVVEAFVPFHRELSMLGVRARDGRMAFYPPVENRHASGILARSEAPARCDGATIQTLESASARVLERLGYVGVLAIEFFDLGPHHAGEGGPAILANEMAPRVHNSGHWTIEGAACSQFENHVRAVCNMPLGSTRVRGHSTMLNIIGADPDIPGLLALPTAHLHMYGKTPRPGRKLGHVTLCAWEAADPAEATSAFFKATEMLRNC